MEIIATLLKLQPLFTPTPSPRFHKRLFLADLPGPFLMLQGLARPREDIGLPQLSSLFISWSVSLPQHVVLSGKAIIHLGFVRPSSLHSSTAPLAAWYEERIMPPLYTHAQIISLKNSGRWKGLKWTKECLYFPEPLLLYTHTPKKGLQFVTHLSFEPALSTSKESCWVLIPCVSPGTNCPPNNLSAYQQGLIHISVTLGGGGITGLRFPRLVLDCIPQLDILRLQRSARVSNKTTFDLVNEARF